MRLWRLAFGVYNNGAPAEAFGNKRGKPLCETL